jgi:hypothetical protein
MRDFRALMVKYGRIDFLVEMNGTNGHHEAARNGSR